MENLVRKSLKLTAALVGLSCIVLVVMQKMRFAAGILIGSLWSAVNFLLLINLLKTAVLRRSKTKLLLTLIIKFPVLYLIGFFILISRFFPISSLLIGLGSIFLAGGITSLCQRRK